MGILLAGNGVAVKDRGTYRRVSTLMMSQMGPERCGANLLTK